MCRCNGPDKRKSPRAFRTGKNPIHYIIPSCGTELPIVHEPFPACARRQPAPCRWPATAPRAPCGPRCHRQLLSRFGSSHPFPLLSAFVHGAYRPPRPPLCIPSSCLVHCRHHRCRRRHCCCCNCPRCHLPCLPSVRKGAYPYRRHIRA